MLDPEDKDDLDNREYEDFPQVTSLLSHCLILCLIRPSQEPTYLQASYLIPAYSEDEETRDTAIMKAPSKRYCKFMCRQVWITLGWTSVVFA